ncbi:MAG: hypothetical protein PHF74_06530 [Dehalococcoidales bacterium]|nr:hypothetical protein [Dehalococcoidales bacterium]
MESITEYMNEYKKQMEKGHIQKAYQGLMSYIMALRAYFQDKYPGYYVSGNIYYGYMDMTYFSFSPKSLKERNLKVAIVFIHEAFRFEVWLSGYNRNVQKQYWQLFQENNWNKYRIVPQDKGVDSILEYTLDDNPDFGDTDKLTGKIEKTTLSFIKDIEDFLSKH